MEAEDDGTRLTYTEQAVHFDRLDSVAGREEGTRGLLDNLGSLLASAALILGTIARCPCVAGERRSGHLT